MRFSTFYAGPLLDPVTGVIGGVGALAGGALSASGASSAAKATNKAGADALAAQQAEGDLGIARMLIQAFGPEQGLAQLKAFIPADRLSKMIGTPSKSATPLTQEQQRRLQEIDAKLSSTRSSGSSAGVRGIGRNAGTAFKDTAEGRALQAEKDALLKMSGGDPGSAGSLDLEAIKKLGPGFLSEQTGLANQYEGLDAKNLQEFDAATSGLDAQALGIERGMKGYGDSEKARIDREAGRALQGANRQAQAALMGAGVGNSTLVANQMGANATRTYESASNQKGIINDNLIRMLSEARGQRLNLGMSRAGQRTALGVDGQNRTLSLRQAPINTKIGILSGPTMNPMQGVNMAGFFPGASAGGAAASVFGNALGGTSGYLLGNALAKK